MPDNYEELQRVIDAIPIAIYIKDISGNVVLMNQPCEQQWGICYSDFKNLVQFSVATLGPNSETYANPNGLNPEIANAIAAQDKDALVTLEKIEVEQPFWNYTQQEMRLAHISKTPICHTDGTPHILLCTSIDITANSNIPTACHSIEDQLNLASLMFGNASEGVMVCDDRYQILAVNPAFSRISGYSPVEVMGKTPTMFTAGLHEVAFFQDMLRSIQQTGHWRGELMDKHKSGEIRTKWVNISTSKKQDGSIGRYVAIFSDITEKKKADKLIWQQANFDALTNLPNRNMLQERLDHELKLSTRANLPLSFLLIDLDDFKEVNDTLGHEAGDALLKEAARRITECVSDSDTVARLGGDEFSVILPEQSDAANVERVAENINAKIAQPFYLGEEVVYVSASIGITIYPHDAQDIETLMKNADQAMYAAKKQGRNRYSYFTQSLQEAAQKRLRLANDLRGALAANQFILHFQPIVELNTGHIHKAEALLRWQHPERGLVSPLDFIPIAEETGLIHEIGDWVFRESAMWAKRWSTHFSPNFQVSINKSPVQFQNEGNSYALKWFQHLNEQELSGNNIVLEITEGLLMDINSGISSKLLQFRDTGLQVAIDDFGTGYSSLSYLKKFDIDYLKIDQSFVQSLETDANDMALCEAIIVMAHKLGLKVIAEGVETQQQRDLLAGMYCDYVQGYFDGRPMLAADLEKVLEREALSYVN